MKKRNQNGFGLVEALLIIIAAGIVGFGGYYVWHTNHKTATTTPAKTATTSTQKYLTIKEWGVKLPVKSPIESAYYALSSDSQGTYYVYVSLPSSPDVCAATTQFGGGIGAITRFKANDKDPLRDPVTYLSEDPTAPKVGDYYFTYTRSNSTCATEIEKAGGSFTSINDAFKLAVQSTQAD